MIGEKGILMLTRSATHFFCVSFIIPIFMCGCDMNSDSEQRNNGSQRDREHQVTSTQIAICDIDEIAKELGLLGEMERILSKQKTLLANEVRKLQSNQQMRFDDKRREFGEFPDEEQKQQLARLQVTGSQTIRQMNSRANQIFVSIRASLIEQIRTKIKKPIDKVATEKNIPVIFSDHQDLVLYMASAANITPDVLSAARRMDLGSLEFESPTGTETKPDSTNGLQSEKRGLGGERGEPTEPRPLDSLELNR